MPDPMMPSDRTVSDLARALDDARSRRPEDGADPDVPVAATVVLLRDGGGGLEVLMIERPDRGSFAGAWVFPGGKVEAVDRVTPAEPEEDVARRAAVRETQEEIGLVLDQDALVPLSCWDPPPGLALRIRTWFFLAAGGPAEATADMVLSESEVVSAAWLRPADALAAHGRGELTLYPPTWVTLHGLSMHVDSASALMASRVTGVERFETVARRGGEGPLLLWRGDAEYDTGDDGEHDVVPGGAASAARHRLDIGALPWRYQRSE